VRPDDRFWGRSRYRFATVGDAADFAWMLRGKGIKARRDGLDGRHVTVDARTQKEDAQARRAARSFLDSEEVSPSWTQRDIGHGHENPASHDLLGLGIGITPGEAILGIIGLGIIGTLIYAVYQTQQTVEDATQSVQDTADQATLQVNQASSDIQGALGEATSQVTQTGQSVQSTVQGAQRQAQPVVDTANWWNQLWGS